jgi:Ssp1 endopeptidase immunity protein Rap1a
MPIWLMLACASPVAAKAPDNKFVFEDQTAAELIQQCEAAKDKAEDKDILLGTCLGYIRGAQAGAELIISIAEQSPPWCVPAGASRGDVMEMLISFVKKHPSVSDQSAANTVIAALGDAYPCKEEGAK